jgi:PIN domain nuclease of toxin-antitoxin system
MRSLPDPPLLLDTHVWIWAMTGAEGELGQSARSTITSAAEGGRLLVSVISVWEVGMLESKGRLHLAWEVGEWVRRALSAPGIALAPLTPEVALDSSRLPAPLHGDPADRMLIATARRTGARLVTRDAKILEYGDQGMLAVIDAGR